MKKLLIGMFLAVLFVLLLFNQNGWSSEKYYYKQSGVGGYFNDIAWATIPNANDIGQWTHTNKKYGYGDFSWDGKFISKGDQGWSIQGLTDGKACKYIAFELIYTDRIFRCITYNKTTTNEQNGKSTSTILRFFNFTKWNHYGIKWRHNYCAFYINGVEVANHTENIPNIKLYFHVHTCVAPWMKAPGGYLMVIIKNLKEVIK